MWPSEGQHIFYHYRYTRTAYLHIHKIYIRARCALVISGTGILGITNLQAAHQSSLCKATAPRKSILESHSPLQSARALSLQSMVAFAPNTAGVACSLSAVPTLEGGESLAEGSGPPRGEGAFVLDPLHRKGAPRQPQGGSIPNATPTWKWRDCLALPCSDMPVCAAVFTGNLARSGTFILNNVSLCWIIL